jgi:hypothetical protein
VPPQDERSACAHYEHDGPEHKRAEEETEVLHQGVACAEDYAGVEAEAEVTPLGCPHPVRLGAVSYIL